MNDIPKTRRTRADALRNREQILRAAVELMVEHGPTVPLETIARRAGVGIATLYRHFPDRTVLLRQLALDLLTQSATAAEVALAEEPDAFTALARYLHDAIDLRIGVVMPMVAERMLMDEEVLAARNASRRKLAEIVQAAHDEGSLRPDVGSGDIGLLVTRMAPPLPAISPEDNHRLSHRHMELVLDGLLGFLAYDSLPGRPLALEELGQLPRDGDGNFLPVMEGSTDRCWESINRQNSLKNGAVAGNEGRSTTSGS
ncbi:TetR/AcrR family transcriptional regulator [Actinophytocola sp. NPDC049390]|uniref:TetR/AcrR family transcriptional regulator n=1 Tax=Actinophytocola sp. NPDC049390 TaxID=3363894 RepID=UPI0037941D1D